MMYKKLGSAQSKLTLTRSLALMRRRCCSLIPSSKMPACLPARFWLYLRDACVTIGLCFRSFLERAESCFRDWRCWMKLKRELQTSSLSPSPKRLLTHLQADSSPSQPILSGSQAIRSAPLETSQAWLAWERERKNTHEIYQQQTPSLFPLMIRFWQNTESHSIPSHPIHFGKDEMKKNFPFSDHRQMASW